MTTIEVVPVAQLDQAGACGIGHQAGAMPASRR